MIRRLREGAVATVLLDRPEARNAIPLAGWRALTGMFVELAASAVETGARRSDRS